MKLEKVRIGFAITGSFCTFDKIKKELKHIVEAGADITPIFSFHASGMNTRFGNAKEFVKEVEEITKRRAVLTIQDAEPLGPKNLLDILIIAPCTGNTISKLSNGITDTPVLMAAKAHMRNHKPLVISISTNDALGINFSNIGTLLNCKDIFFVPFGQDNYEGKPKSMIARTELIIPALEMALEGKQLQPIIL